MGEQQWRGLEPGTQYPASFDYGDQTIRFVYRTLALDEMERFRREYHADGFEYAVALLVATLVSWDLEGDDDKPLPITRTQFVDLPFDFIQGLLAAANANLQVRIAESYKGGGFHA